MGVLESDRPTRACIDGEAFLRNLKKLRALTPGKFFCPMIKANAYGHGAKLIYDLLKRAKVKSCGVATLAEAMELANASASGPEILIFGRVQLRNLKIVAQKKWTLVIGSLSELSDAARAKQKLSIHLKVDTGMHRRGLDPGELGAAREILDNHPNLTMRGLCSHFYFAEKGFSPASENERQLRVLQMARDRVFADRKILIHSLNSIALEELGEKNIAFGDDLLGSRPGLYLYGAHPHYEPVMSLRSKIMQVREISKGEGVSYGWTWRAPRDSKVGIVPLGYGDGYLRRLGNCATARLAGREIRVIGNVCMDFLLVDLTDHAFGDRELKEEITFFGRDPYGKILAVEKIATLAETIPWEILTLVSHRVPRVLLRRGHH